MEAHSQADPSAEAGPDSANAVAIREEASQHLAAGFAQAMLLLCCGGQKKRLIENKSNPISKKIRGLAEHINLVITALVKLAALCWPPKPCVVTSDYLVHFAFPCRKPTGSCSLEEADLNPIETLSLKFLL